MAMGLRKGRQADLMVGRAEMPRSPGHVSYDRLQSVLIEGGFDGFAEAACQRCFRMRLVGYIEGIDSGRGLEWRGSDSLSLRELSKNQTKSGHSMCYRTGDFCLLLTQAELALFEYINGFYNPRRRHPALNGKSPLRFERRAA